MKNQLFSHTKSSTEEQLYLKNNRSNRSILEPKQALHPFGCRACYVLCKKNQLKKQEYRQCLPQLMNGRRNAQRGDQNCRMGGADPTTCHPIEPRLSDVR